MHFLDDKLEAYITEHTEDEPAVLRELSRETHLKVLHPRMLTGRHQGRFLSLLSKLCKPRSILEIGTYTGYSALCLAEGLQEGGELHTIDINEELEAIQDHYFAAGNYPGKIIRHTGDAVSIIPTIDRVFDLVFVDGEKREYNRYLDVILPKTRSGSLILSDNVLWSGKVVEPLKAGDKATAALLDYNRRLKEDSRLETVLLPIRDGLTMSLVR